MKKTAKSALIRQIRGERDLVLYLESGIWCVHSCSFVVSSIIFLISVFSVSSVAIHKKISLWLIFSLTSCSKYGIIPTLFDKM
jgi:hypothetical protein